MRLKTLFSILIIAFVAVSCKKDVSEQEDPTIVHEDFKDYDLNTSVKSILITTKIPVNDKNDSTSLKISHKEQIYFNEKGQLTQKKMLGSDDKIYEEHFFSGKNQLEKTIKYNNGIVFETTVIKRNSKNEIYTISKFDSNEQLNEIEKYEYQNDLLFRKIKLNNQNYEIEKIVYEYKNAQLLEKETLYGRNNQIRIIKKYAYDERENLIEVTDINAQNEIVLKTINTYSANNELVQTDYLNKKQQLVRSEKKKYDEKGRLIYFVVLDETGKQIATETKYNDSGKILGYQQYEDDVMTESVSYSYDANGFLLETLDNIERNSLLNSQFEYEIDNKKNWTKKTLLMNNMPLEIVERTIVYF